MLDLMRRYMDAGREAVTGERAEDLARDLLDWSRRNAERLSGLVRREVQRQLRLAGVATRDEVSELKKRVRELEQQVAAAPAGRTAGKKTSARSPATKTSTRKTPAKKTSAGKASATTGRKATSRRATE